MLRRGAFGPDEPAVGDVASRPPFVGAPSTRRASTTGGPR
jgi:hypothetical protein